MRELDELDESSSGPAGSADIAPQPSDNSSAVWLEAEVEALRQYISWLEQLECGEPIVVKLRLETDPATEFVLFDEERIRRVLTRIAADLEDIPYRAAVRRCVGGCDI